MHNNLEKSYTPSQAWSVVILHIGVGIVQHQIENMQARLPKKPTY